MLHDHLDGGLRVAIVLELADKIGWTLPTILGTTTSLNDLWTECVERFGGELEESSETDEDEEDEDQDPTAT